MVELILKRDSRSINKVERRERHFLEKFGLLSTERCHNYIDKTVIKQTNMNGLHVRM